jgi:molecular chaperone DnaK
VEVTFDIDANGVLTVTAKDKETGKEQKITVSGSTQLSKDEIDRMLKDAQAHAADDKRRREEVAVRNTADSIAHDVERQMRDLGDKVPANEKARADQIITQIRELVKSESSDLAQMRQSTSDLQQIAHALSSAANPSAASAAHAGGASTNAEEVIDAEFKETK